MVSSHTASVNAHDPLVVFVVVCLATYAATIIAVQFHMERFVRSAPKPPQLPGEVWINKPVSVT